MDSIFPANSAEALAMLYLQNRDIKELSPEQLADLYDETVNKIIERQLQIRRGKSSLPVLNSKPRQ